MSFALILDAVRCANLNGIRLVMKDRERAREYWSQALQRYYELMGYGLSGRFPLDFVYQQDWATPSAADRLQLPVTLQLDGGTRLDELLLLATVTRVLRPRSVFEIGTFTGQTTSVFILNAPPTSTVVTLDLPPDAEPAADSRSIDSDVVLIKQRRVGSVLRQLELEGRYEQLFADTLQFDPTPFAGSIELGFIDGAHSREYVENDTRKMAVMMSDRGLVFWHDYGGRGRFRPLTNYLDDLARTISIYRVPNMTLAWAPAAEIRKLVR